MLCNTLSISFKGVKSHEIIDKISEKVAVSAGSKNIFFFSQLSKFFFFFFFLIFF